MITFPENARTLLSYSDVYEYTPHGKYVAVTNAGHVIADITTTRQRIVDSLIDQNTARIL